MSQRAARSQEGLSQRRRGLPCEHSHVLPPRLCHQQKDISEYPLFFPFLLSDGVKELWNTQFLGFQPNFLPSEEVPDTQTSGLNRGLTAFEICGGSEG